MSDGGTLAQRRPTAVTTTTGDRRSRSSSASRADTSGSVRRRRSRSRDDRPDSARSSLSTMDRDQVLATLGYKSAAGRSEVDGAAALDRSELCLRCGKKVYPVEKVDVGGLYHKGCFKCKTCGVHLTLKTFNRDSDLSDPKRTKEIYCRKHVPRSAGGALNADAIEIRRAVNAQKHASAQMRGTGYEHESHYADALEHRHQAAPPVKRRSKVKRRSTLRSSQDFEKFGVYDAQKALEDVHRQEEDELYRQMFDDRKRQVERLERHLRDERNRTVRELVTWFERRGASEEERQAGLNKIENYYAAQRTDRMQLLLQKLTIEEQAAVARIIEKHSQEMLVLIQEKEREAEKAMKFEFRDSQLLEGKEVPAEESEDTEEEEEEEEDSQEEQEESQDVSESFSEASYRVDLSERASMVKRVGVPGMARAKGFHYGSDGALDKTKVEDATYQNFDRHGRTRSSLRQPGELQRQRHPHSHQEQLGARKQQHGYQSQQGSLPPEYFPFELDEEGDVLVRVHGAKDARLISDHLKSSHFCQSPEANKPTPVFYDFTSNAKQPKPFRRKASELSGSGVPRAAKQKGAKAAMKFQRPGEELDEDEEGDENNKKGRKKKASGVEGNSTTKKRSGKKKRGSNQQLEDIENLDIDSKLRNHAERAREALRNMSLGLSSNADDEDNVFLNTLPSAPKVAPPPTKKTNLYNTPDVFKELDDNAVRETKRDHRTFTELVRQLSRRCQNEIQRVRALFRWITAKDLNKMQFSDELDPESPVGLLRGIKFGVESYHNLLKRLCSYAGLHCEIVEGYSKGAGYKPGGRFKGNVFRNQWTAVSVEGAWRFVNCNWGARHVKGTKDELMTYKCDEFYFLTDPEDHIYQHFPDDPEWQLLKSPITMDEFVKLPVVKSPFFNRQLSFSMDYDSAIHTSDGTAEIRIMSPHSTNFAAQLKPKDGHIKSEILQDRVLVRFVNNEVIFVTNLPASGVYFLEIYVGEKPDSMDNCCAFRLCCYGVSANVHVSYPPVPCFGRTPGFKRTKIQEETHTDPLITHSGELLIAFFTSSDNRIAHSLKFWNHRDRKMEDFDRYAFLTHRSDHLVTFLIQPPRRGGYVFALLASNDPDASSSRLKCVYRYYIDCRAACENANPLPKATKRWQGCRLIEPMLGDLPCRTKVRFKVESAAAVEMVVSLNDKWTHLQKSGNLWQGVVQTGEDRDKLYLYGRFISTKEKYIPLLEYNVRGPKRMEDEISSLMRYLHQPERGSS